MSRWLRLRRPEGNHFEINHLLDYYWGGSERRLTGLTLRIMAVNAIALLILMAGILHLGQYQNRLIETRLSSFETELNLIAATLSETTEINADTKRIEYSQTIEIAERYSSILNHSFYIFDAQGQLIAKNVIDVHDTPQTLQSVETLIQMLRFVLSLLPEKDTLPSFPELSSEDMRDYPNVPGAFKGQTSLSAWQGETSRVYLSAATPLVKDNTLLGAIFLTRESHDIEQDIIRVWNDILWIFLLTLTLTILLSIYLSGVIARPLKRLAKAAERVRKGQAGANDIPDLSTRYDEIGELSLVLKQMTHALWDRMDATERFAADVAHELKNPITSMRSAAETMKVVKKAADRKKLMEIIEHDISRMDRLITDIAQASRLDSELSREAFEKIDLQNLLHTLLNNHQAPLERQSEDFIAQGWALKTTIDGVDVQLSSTTKDKAFLMGVQTRIYQVFENLISNALTFSPKDKPILVTVKAAGRYIDISIENEGPEIPDNKLETIFKRFYTQRPDHESYGRHSGLGLYICREIIEAHSGKIRAENITDAGQHKGVRFTVTLNAA